ncbi:hypothetical protein BJ138DRAFT_148273 [Hygrophoropsis aurantiaca]|uniref:Uncharacterized protein n=1 Tax=Hygrophoropsis aurantiaca TaxID=72124 RepID=A0ACB8APS0_9AGAM|nr:hypothetical protein BJ138DRAFT_148273 [Hygrophoropsis aurantiaca]
MGTSAKDPVLNPTLNGGEAPRRTVAEIAREKRLRDDPMAEVHGPLFVTCRRCGNRIKLSPKSSYDPFHWTKHRERCLKKPAGVARVARRDIKEIYGSLKTKSPPSSNTDGELNTPPPLTPDDDRRMSADAKSESSDSEMDIPATKTSDLPLVDHGRWQTWNWDQLRPPPWMFDDSLALIDNNDDDDDEDYTYDDYDSMPTPVYQTQPRVPALKLSLHLGTRT